MAWQDILKEFQSQFGTVGPEKYANIDNPAIRYQLAADRNATTQGVKSAAITGLSQENAAKNAAADKAASADSYTRQRNKSGGYTFYDGNGNEISAWDFSLAKDVSVADVLAGSMDPGDKMFLEDLSAMDQDLKTINPNTGKPIIDYQTALDKISSDYSNIFFGKGTPTGGKNLKEYSKRARVSSAEGQYGTAPQELTGNFLQKRAAKGDTIGEKPVDLENAKRGANNIVTNFLTNVKALPDKQAAISAYNQLVNSGELDKYDAKGVDKNYNAEMIKKSLQQIIEDLYPEQEQYNPIL